MEERENEILTIGLVIQMHTMQPSHIQQAVQAVTIYIIMSILDQDHETPARGARLMQTFLVSGIHVDLIKFQSRGSGFV